MDTVQILGLISGSSVLTGFFVHFLPKLIDYWSGRQNNNTILKHELSSLTNSLANQNKNFEDALKAQKDMFEKGFVAQKEMFEKALSAQAEANAQAMKSFRETVNLMAEKRDGQIADLKKNYDSLDTFLRSTLTKVIESKK